MSTRETRIKGQIPLVALTSTLMAALLVFLAPMSASAATVIYVNNPAPRNVWLASNTASMTGQVIAGNIGGMTVQGAVLGTNVATGSPDSGLTMTFARKTVTVDCRWIAPTWPTASWSIYCAYKS